MNDQTFEIKGIPYQIIRISSEVYKVCCIEREIESPQGYKRIPLYEGDLTKCLFWLIKFIKTGKGIKE